jgi:hypothetical protein
MPSINLTQKDKTTLLNIARQSIAYGLQNRRPLRVDINACSRSLQSKCASFITLKLNRQLRGCIGALTAHQPLAKDVAEHAFAAAFKDSRFSPLSAAEQTQLDIHISILTPPENMHCVSEDELLQQLQPGIDGLIFTAGKHQATFLPSVWESLPTSQEFVQQLKLKAGLDKDFWSKDVQLQRYRTISIADQSAK